MQKILQKKWVAMECAVLCTVLWGSAYPVIKYGYAVMQTETTADKLMFAGVRFFLAGLMVFVFAWIKNRRVPTVPKNRVGGVLLYGALQTGLMYIFNYIGVANTTATKTSIITAASAFFAVIFTVYTPGFVGLPVMASVFASNLRPVGNPLTLAVT